MYEDTKSSIDWKGLFLKVIIAFLIVLIAVKGYTTLKSKTNSNTAKTTTEATADSKSSTTFTENMKKLKEAGQSYFDSAKDKLPSKNGATSMITLNELISNGKIDSLTDEDGKVCDGESSYVTAILDEKEYKLKANLVCGSASSYSLVYLGQNDYTNTTSNTTTSTNSTKASSNTNTSNCDGNTCSICTTGNCDSAVKVSTNTSVSQSVNIGNKNNTSTNSGKTNVNSTPSNSYTYTPPKNNTRYYTVTFDRNGGDKSITNMTVKEYNTVSYPGDNSKSGCSFNGWYLNGSKYDFNTPVTNDITLVANYTCYSYNNNNNNNYNDDDEEELVTKTTTTTVYTMGWANYGTRYITINHTLKIPEELDNNKVENIRIKDITFRGPINTATLVDTYNRRHSETFIYSPNGWEATEDNSSLNLATINGSAVSFDYSSRYKTLRDARYDGFNVSWYASNVAKQCSRTFSVNGETNKCDYGIYYKVTWQYTIYE